MSTASCVFLAGGLSESTARVRASRLVAWFSPLGATNFLLEPISDHHWVGLIPLDGRDGAARTYASTPRLIAWGSVPTAWSDPEAVIEATDDELRSFRQPGCAIAWNPQRARIVTSASPVRALHACGDVWSTHAVAAAYLAHGQARFDAEGLRALRQIGHVGARGALIDGVDEVPSATVIDLGGRTTRRSFWPSAERYAPLTSGQDHIGATSEALVRAAGSMTTTPPPALGLTAGKDSLVCALALRDADVSFSAFTWGSAVMPERDAYARAQTLGISHQTLDFGLEPDEEAGLRALRAEARWSEGHTRLSARGTPGWPSGAGAVVTGAGGETGRAFFYRWEALRRSGPPGPRDLLRLASRDDSGLEAEAASWLDAVAQLGLSGWQTLDGLYVELRLKRWARGMLARAHVPTLAPMLDPDVQRGLLWLPLDQRLSDGFHHAFITARHPELAPPPPPKPRRGIPDPVRRAARALRSARRSHGPSISDLWNDRPLELAFLADDILAAPTVIALLGKTASANAGDAIRHGNFAAIELATTLAGAVELERALRTLNSVDP